MLSRMMDTIERTPLSASGFACAFAGIILIRTVLEALSSPSSSGFLPLDAPTTIHYALFYVAAYLAVTLVLGFFTKNYRNAAKAALFGFCIIWLPPIIDLISTGGAGSSMAYIFEAPAALILDFLTFFGPLDAAGITLGIRIEILLVLAAVAWRVYGVRKSLHAAGAAALTVYAALFALVALPSLIYALVLAATHLPVTSPSDTFVYLMQESNVVANALPRIAEPATSLASSELGFNKLMSLAYVPLLAGLGLLLVSRLDRKAFAAHTRNVRPLRALLYLALVALGAWSAAVFSSAVIGIADLFGVFALLLAWLAAWIAAVCMNDVYDQEIDAVSNAGRPLTQQAVTESGMHDTGVLLVLFSFLAAYAAGQYALVFLIAFTCCYYVYSVPPLRLKRVPVLSSLLIGFAALFSILGGYMLISPDKTLSGLPPFFVLGVIACFTLAVNVRDLKDIEGDSRAGVATIATMLAKRFGRPAAFHGIGMCVAVAYLLSPLAFPFLSLWMPALICGALSYLACVMHPFREHRIFFVFFVYAAAIVFSLGA